ncbi:MAG TPA: TetR/AcrR family transcriptional regulator [Acidimicrobiales bacterium]|nr:TetR/AcrR family transcriptional regulator [Acidimicrobiales bacterium]
MAVPADVSEATSGGRSSRRTERRAELLDAAIRVIRREGDTVAMEGIAGEAGISRPILYRHFGDATGLYAAVARRFGDELAARLLRSASEGDQGRELLRRQASIFFAFVAEEPNLYRFLARRAPPRRSPGPQRNDFVLLVASRTAEFLMAAGWPQPSALVAADLLVGGLEAAADRWLDEPLGTPDELAGVVTSLLWSGLGEASNRVAGGEAPT